MSHKEMLFYATRRALDDAGLDRSDIRGAITASSDFLEGRSLSNQYTLDSIGGVMKPSDLRLAEDGMHALFAGYMEVAVDPSLVVVVASVQKSSECAENGNAYQKLLTAAMEPVYSRPVCGTVDHPEILEAVLAAMDARAYLNRTGVSEEQLAKVALKNINNAAMGGGRFAQTLDQVLSAEMLSPPVRTSMTSAASDAACTIILTSEKRARELGVEPVLITGVGWCSEHGDFARRSQGMSPDTAWAARQAYRMAGIRKPREEIDLAEVNDWYAHRELIHCEALGLCQPGEAGSCLESGDFDADGPIPVNVSGGLIGRGNPIIPAGLMCVAEVARQIRGDANGRQVDGVNIGLAHSWGGFSSPTAGVAVLSKW